MILLRHESILVFFCWQRVSLFWPKINKQPLTGVRTSQEGKHNGWWLRGFIEVKMDRIKGNIHYSMSKIDFRWYMNYDFPVWYRRLHSWWYCMNKGHTVYGIFTVFLTLHASGTVNVYREGVCWRVIITAQSDCISFRWSGRTNEIQWRGSQRKRERILQFV